MHRIVAGDISALNSETYLACRDHADLFWQVDVVGEGCGDVGAGSNVKSLDLSELYHLRTSS